MKTKSRTFATAALALLIFSLGFSLHISDSSNLDHEMNTDSQHNAPILAENANVVPTDENKSSPAVLKVTGKQKSSDPESASSIAQMGIASEQEEIEQEFTEAQDTMIAVLLEENEVKHAQPKPKVKVQKTEGSQAPKLPDRVRAPLKKPKVDISNSKPNQKSDELPTSSKLPKSAGNSKESQIYKGVQGSKEAKEPKAVTAQKSSSGAVIDSSKVQNSVPSAKVASTIQFPWSYDMNEGPCDYDLAFRSEFQIFNVQHHEFRQRLSAGAIEAAQDELQEFLLTVEKPRTKFHGRGVVYSG